MKLLIKPLRKALTPLSSPTPPSPPPNPCPWLWRCHSCYTIYRLAVTRRCLDCDHMFCLGEAGGAPPKGKKRKRGGPCKAEFDYTGWKARGSWRRTVLLNGATTTSLNATLAATGHNETNWGDEHTAVTQSHGGEDEARFEDKRERLFLRRRHNCFIHCDFPSECHHSLFRAQQEGRPILRAAEALDAAEEEAARVVAEVEREKAKEGGRQWARRLTVQEYKQRRAERRAERQGRKLVSAASAARLGGDLSTVDEEDDHNVSPCSPTFDGSGDLMREVSPVENEPLSPSDRSPSRASLLVTTDTPVDFATTAAPLSFDDDTYSDDDQEGGEESGAHDDERRRTKSRRKIAQLTGEGPESFGPFVLSGPSPTSPSAARPENNPTALDLQAAWSEQEWFSSSSSTLEQQQQPQSPKSPERIGKRDRMFALLGRRGSGGPASPTRSSHDVLNMPAAHRPQHQAQHADATAVAGEEWESWSESSSSSSTSTSSRVSLPSSSSIKGGRDTHGAAVDDTDADGDVTMHDDEDEDSPVTPEGEHGTGPSGDETDNLRALLRMRNAFMRGEMM